MAEYNFKIEGLVEFQDAIKRNPAVVKREVANFLKRGTAVYTRTILNNPWRVGMSGGGAPVATGNLRDTHQTQFSTWEASIRPTAPYAIYVHKKRPWLDYAFNQNQKELDSLEGDLIDNIVENLAK